MSDADESRSCRAQPLGAQTKGDPVPPGALERGEFALV